MPSDPSFETPPLVEVSYSVQFEPIVGFHIGLFGLIWDSFRDRYPIVKNVSTLDHEIEKFGVIARKRQQFKFTEGVPETRVYFYSADEQFLIQIQKDRFICNWRSLPNQTCSYPRYEYLKKSFLKEYEIFCSAIIKYGCPTPIFNQVEFTYVNHVDATEHTVAEVFTNLNEDPSHSKSMELESFSIKLKHLITIENKRIGRMYTSIEKGQLSNEGNDIYILKFTSRCHPEEPTLDAVKDTMDIMRDKINTSFTTITTEEMHDLWQREEQH